jgi:hypothetical protein
MPVGSRLASLAPVAFDPCAPIVVVGAGRSGSTLLVRVLDSHPDISFKGETKFLLSRLWNTLWENTDWYMFPKYLASPRHSSGDFGDLIDDQTLAEGKDRAGSLFAGLMAGLLDADPSCRFWGYKEIWNGSGSWQIPWDAYDRIFPRATWVHLIRHPFDFLGSALAWNGWEVSLPALQHGLAEWVAIVRCSRGRAATGRYHEIRFEDLRASPRAALTPIFDGVGIPWNDACANIVKKKVGDAHRDTLAEKRLFPQLKRTPELRELAEAYGYTL